MLHSLLETCVFPRPATSTSFQRTLHLLNIRELWISYFRFEILKSESHWELRMFCSEIFNQGRWIEDSRLGSCPEIFRAHIDVQTYTNILTYSYTHIHMYTYMHAYMTWRDVTWGDVTPYLTLCYTPHIPVQYIALQYIALHCVALRCTAFHYITLQYNTIKYIKITVHTSMYTYYVLCIYVCMCI